MIEHYFSKPVVQAFNSQGEIITDISNVIDGSVVRGLVGNNFWYREQRFDYYERKIIRQVLTDKAVGKILLEQIVDSEGEVLAEPGTEITLDMLDEISRVLLTLLLYVQNRVLPNINNLFRESLL